MCLSARCVLVCCCTAGTSAQSHLAGTALPTPVHSHTGSSVPTAPCVLHCTVSTLCAVLHCLVLCTAMHCTVCALPHCTCGQWAVEFVQRSATPLGDGGQWNSCNARSHQLGGRGVLPRRRSLPEERTPCTALPHCLGAVGSATHAMHRLTAWGQWAVQLLRCTAPLPGGSGQCSSYNALPHCLGAVGSGTPAMRGPSSWGDGESCLGGVHYRKERNSCNALPHRLRAVGGGIPVIHCLTAWG